jgi:hypothetical protein
MNTIKTLVIVTLITFSSQVSAFTRIPENNIKPIYQQIERFLNNSEMIIYDDVIVTVKFKLNQNNKIIIISNDSDNYEIIKFIKANLNLKKLYIAKRSNKNFYSVAIRFLATED